MAERSVGLGQRTRWGEEPQGGNALLGCPQWSPCWLSSHSHLETLVLWGARQGWDLGTVSVALGVQPR